MEALEFLKEYNRMCTMYKSCRRCPLEMDKCAGCGDEFSEKQIINIIEKTEQWSKEHPIITNAHKFEEVFGFNGNTVNKVKPQIGIGGTKGSCGYDKCTESCGSRCFPRCPMWWNDEFKEPEHENE